MKINVFIAVFSSLNFLITSLYKTTSDSKKQRFAIIIAVRTIFPKIGFNSLMSIG